MDTGIDAGVAVDALFRVDHGLIRYGNRADGAGFLTGFAGIAVLFINDSGHTDLPDDQRIAIGAPNKTVRSF